MEIIKPSEAELEILQILWAKQPCTIKVIHESISRLRAVGYTTTSKQIQRMEEKGLVKRAEGDGKAHTYTAAVPAAVTKQHLLDRLMERAFGNSVSDLVLHALGKAQPSADEIEAIQKYLDQLTQKDSDERTAQ